LSSIIGEAIPTIRTRRLALFCDVEVGDSAYSLVEARTILRAARGAGLRLKLSAVGGSVEEALQLAVQLETTSVDFCAATPLPSIEKMRSVDVIPVVLPSRFFIPRLTPPDVRPMLDRGASVALGTDHGTTSPGIGSMWLILAIAVAQLGMTLDEAITACTYNAARAVGFGSETGSLEVGKKADLLILDVADHRELLDGLGRNPVEVAVVEGRVVSRR
jgi:imidazolonepropionase